MSTRRIAVAVALLAARRTTKAKAAMVGTGEGEGGAASGETTPANSTGEIEIESGAEMSSVTTAPRVAIACRPGHPGTRIVEAEAQVRGPMEGWWQQEAGMSGRRRRLDDEGVVRVVHRGRRRNLSPPKCCTFATWDIR